ncbi:hypothetical protein WJX84_001670 [Apatococcus fuscideae]|uniref:Uncharacterized protein n=1 Tax=Apatococcus fuscideae TaxID=2026836 RepID=A0AAW1SU73_9CHLO
MPRSRVSNDPQSFTISPWQQKKKQPRTKDPPEYSQSNFAIKPTLGLHHPTHSIPEVSSKLPPESVEQLCPPATSDQLGPSLVESEAYLVLMDSGSVYGGAMDSRGRPKASLTLQRLTTGRECTRDPDWQLQEQLQQQQQQQQHRRSLCAQAQRSTLATMTGADCIYLQAPPDLTLEEVELMGDLASELDSSFLLSFQCTSILAEEPAQTFLALANIPGQADITSYEPNYYDLTSNHMIIRDDKNARLLDIESHADLDMNVWPQFLVILRVRLAMLDNQAWLLPVFAEHALVDEMVDPVARLTFLQRDLAEHRERLATDSSYRGKHT